MYFSAILKQCENLVSIDNQNTKTQKREWGNVRRKFAHIFGGLCFQERQLAWMLGEDSVLRERRQQCAQRLELYRSARDEIEAVCWSG